MKKKCNDCGIIKNVKEFSIRRSSKDGYYNKCKGCRNIYSKKYYEKNETRLSEYREKNRDILKEKSKKYYYENKNKMNEYSREYYEENKDKIKEYRREWREENKEYNKVYYEDNKIKIKDYYNEYNRNRISNDTLYKLKARMRTSICNSLRNNGYKKGSKTNNMLGCSYEELLDHLNDNKYGFTYGDDNLDIDHIIPLSRATTKDEIIKLNHYSNLQLLPSKYNRHIKRDKDFDSECLEEWLRWRGI